MAAGVEERRRMPKRCQVVRSAAKDEQAPGATRRPFHLEPLGKRTGWEACREIGARQFSGNAVGQAGGVLPNEKCVI